MPTGPFVKVRTGKSSYLKMTEAEADAYRARYGEYGETKIAEDADTRLPDAETDYDAFTVAQLTTIADANEIDVKGMKKPEIIAALKAHEVKLPLADESDAE